jgi:F-type H+-transporting ATPase subunit a
MSPIPTIPLAETDIKIGEHTQVTIAGLTFNVDTIWATVIAGSVVILLGLIVRWNVSATKPGKIQLAWEAIVDYVSKEVEGAVGKTDTYVIHLAIALFTFILVANWLELIPSGEDPKYLPAPTADTNLTYALALLVIVGVHRHSVKRRGWRGYFKSYGHNGMFLLPLTVLEEIVKPFTLALRLFGNIFAGGIMLAIIGLVPVWGLWAPNILWKLFDMFIGLIQAFIFALLTVLYYGIAGETHDDHDDEHEPHPEHVDAVITTSDSTETDAAQPELSGAH